MGRRAPRIALCMMAKAPEAGQVKTRLCPPLSPEEAAALACCFIRDKVAQVREVTRAEPCVAYAPESAAAVFRSLAPDLAAGPDGGARQTREFVLGRLAGRTAEARGGI